MFVTFSRGHLASADRAAFTDSARRSVAAANDQPGCVIYRQMVDLFDPETVYVIEAWESEETFQRHAGADYHHRRIEELVGLDFQPQESYRFGVADWRRGPGADLPALLAGLADSGITEP
ncbi:MAG: antibiotic biosynthesis monooxygenase [Acidimicrobiales bacterium]|nr:antibiotic biosynthesis monooxygenase [Acidimicrobiales bacterium]